MRLLITGGDSRFARAVLAALPDGFTARATDVRFTAALPPGVEAREGDLRDPAFVGEALADVDLLVHFAPLSLPFETAQEAVDIATRGTFTLTTAALDRGIQRLILGSTLDLFARMPAHWKVTEAWRPRPEPQLPPLCAWLSELSVRECVRVAPLHALCLRFGHLVDDAEASSQPYDPRWLHLDDAVAGVRQAIEVVAEAPHQQWRVLHLTAAGERAKVRLAEAGHSPLGYAPQHDFHARWDTLPTAEEPDTRPWQEVLAPAEPIPSRPLRRVVIFGAGGPVATEAALELASSYTLRLTDVLSRAAIAAESKPQFPGAPLAAPFPPPHEERLVDVRDYQAVLAACEGMDAILNCTVVRPDPAEAFRVNTLGAYNIVRAAVAQGIRRVVQTGPQQVTMQPLIGYQWDDEVPGDVPARPGRNLYAHSKYLGQEICRVFADHYGLEVPVLLYNQFLNPEVEKHLHVYGISWRDSARALRRALEVCALPSPYEVMIINADLPHGRFSNRRAKELLDWEPRDSLEHLWSRPKDAS